MSGLRRILAVSAMAIAALGTAGMAVVHQVPKAITGVSARRYDVKRSLFGGSFGRGNYGKRARRGWGPRQVQRMAVKRRNVARNRKATRG